MKDEEEMEVRYGKGSLSLFYWGGEIWVNA